MRSRLVQSLVFSLATVLVLGSAQAGFAQWEGLFGGGSNWGGGGSDWGGGGSQWGGTCRGYGSGGGHGSGNIWEGIFDAGVKAWENSNNHNDHYDHNDYNDYPRRQYSRPRPKPRPKPVAKVKANPVPPEPKAVVKANLNLTTEPISRALAQVINQLAAAQLKQQLDDLQDGIPEALRDDPLVQAALVGLGNAFNNNALLSGRFTPADADALRQAIVAANGGNVPDDALRELIDFGLQALVDSSEIQSILDGFIAGAAGRPPAGPPLLPVGPTTIIYNPGLPPGEVFALPDGTLIVGTGGGGEMFIGRATAAEAMGVPIAIGEPALESEADMSKRTKSGVLLFNPFENGVTMGYVVNNTNYSMKPSYTQQLPGGVKWIVRFSRGPKKGEAKYTLTDGTYYFAPGPNGWELYAKTYGTTIDNSDHATPFEYIVDNKNCVVEAGQVKTHTSKYPILVRFDRGGGKSFAQKKITSVQSTLELAVNPADNRWDLYPPENVAIVGPPPKPLRSSSLAQWLPATKKPVVAAGGS